MVTFPKSSSLIGFSIINHPFWGTTILRKHPYILVFLELFGYTSSICSSFPFSTKTTGKRTKFDDTVDGRNHAPPGMYKPCKQWDKLSTNWLPRFLPSTVSLEGHRFG